MPNFIIKTHQKDTVYKGSQIFILNKGLNSGKPAKEPFTNSFVIQLQNEKDADTLYWLAYTLWKTLYWQQFLIGSVIPFLRISDFKHNFTNKTEQLLREHEVHLKQIQALRLLEEKENQLNQNIRVIDEMKKIILHHY